MKKPLFTLKLTQTLSIAVLALPMTFTVAHTAQAADLISIYRDALVSDPGYQAARFDVDAARERIPQAESAFKPQVSASASASMGYGRNCVSIAGLGERCSSDDSGTRSYGVSGSLPLFNKTSSIQIEQAKQGVAVNEARFAEVQQDLIVRVAQAYFDVLLAQDNVAFSISQKEAISQQLAQAKRNFEVGTATIVDTLEAQARYDQSIAREILDANDLEVKKRAIEQLTGKTVGTLDRVREPLVLAEPLPNKLDDWVTRALDQSNTVRQARLASDIAKNDLEKAKVAYAPTVGLTGGVTAGRTTDAFGSVFPKNINSSIGISVNVPLFTGGLNEARTREAAINKDRADQEIERARRGVTQGVRALFLGVTSGIAQVRALEQALASSQKQLESTILGREVGVRTSVDVLNAQQGVVQTRRDLQSGRYSYLLNKIRLEQTAGQLDEADLQQVNAALVK